MYSTATRRPPRLQLPAAVRIDGLEAEVLYAGAAPGLVAGVVQINARAPQGVRIGPAPLAVSVGLATSQPEAAVVVR